MATSSEPAQHTNEWKTIDRMCEIFSTFAAVGNPNNQLIEPIEWKPCAFENSTQQNDRNNCKILNVSNEVSFIDWIDTERMQFWDKIYEQLGHNRP